MALDDFQMPSFQDPDGTKYVWDPSSQSYVKTPLTDNRPDIGHATGGDNDLFDPFQHTEMSSSPTTEGYMASFDPLDPYGDGTEFEGEGPEREESIKGDPNKEPVCLECGGKLFPSIQDPTAQQCINCGQNWWPEDFTPWGVHSKKSQIDAPPFPEQGEVKCPNCGEATTEHVCPTCKKDLTPEWNAHGQQNEFFDAKPDFNDANEFFTWPQNVPKPNQQNYDNSFPSMALSKIAGADLWDGIFTDSIPMRTEVGKWILDTRGNVHIEQGMGANHQPLMERNGLQPTDQVALGSVYNDGTADVQKVFSQEGLNLDQIREALQQTFGPIQLQPPVGLGLFAEKGEVFVPFDIHGGQWFVPPHSQKITGTAWVKERPNGVEYQPNMILIVEHLRDEDYPLWAQGTPAIITAVGGTGSHAAYLAMTSNVPVVVGIGDSYNKLETGNYVKIDPQNEVIMVAPGATNATASDDKHQMWNDMLQYQRQRGGSVRRPQFSHVIEELNWKEAHSPNLAECPECTDLMMDQGSESVCHGCGHKQPIIVQGAALALLPEAIGLGGEALGVGGAAAGAGEAAGAGGGLSGIGGMMTNALGRGMAFREGENLLGGGGSAAGGAAGAAGGVPFDPSVGTISHQKFAAWDMQHHAFLSELWAWLQNALKGAGGVLAANPIDDALLAGLSGSMGAAHQQVTNQLQPTSALGDNNVGLATRNDGTNSTQDASNSGIEGKEEQGDGPEQLKDVDGGHGSQDSAAGDNLGDPHLQEKALKAFHMNLPLVIQFSESDEPGSENPILAALDAMLEEAFPGYKDGHDQEMGATHEHPQESENPEERDEDVGHPDTKSEGSDKKEAAKVVSLWHFAWDPNYNALTELMQSQAPGGQGIAGGQPAGSGGSAVQICPRCGQAHPEGTPCPVSAVTAPVGNPGTQHVVTKWRLAMPSTMPAAVPQQNAGAPAAPATCPMCGGNHLPGTPCPTAQMQQPAATGGNNLVSPQVGPGVSYSSIDDHFALFDHTDGDGEEDIETPSRHNDDHHNNSYEDEDTDEGDYHSDDDWKDDSGQVLQEGAEYEMSSPASPIPDRVTIEQILPEKLTYTIHSGDIDFSDTITRDQLDLDGITFSPVNFDDTGEDSMDTFPGEEMPTRPGDDALPQQDDLSGPSTVMSHFEPVSLDNYTGSFQGDQVVDRSWLMQGGEGTAEVDPQLMEKFAGKDFSPREQREFIDERGEARNLDRLDLSGTHYIDDDLHTNDTLW